MRISLYVLFAFSGVSGLIYESIWSHYLKLFLGHAAYSQALVLVIFMGGMALGAWLTSRVCHGLKNMLIAYALVEAMIGALGLGFHGLFIYTLAISHDSIIPALGSPFSVQVYKWSICTLLILPQSILLGSTFPLMVNGFLRLFPGSPGRSISILYFTNSLGATIGVIASGFYLINKVGLPGTIMTAGIINITLAVAVYFIAKGKSTAPLVITSSNKDNDSSGLILIAAFITGLASFIYEISWIRMLSMVLGSSTHAFELMLSAFIFGIALGGFWIREKIDRIKQPFYTAAIIQILMGLFAVATIPVYNSSFDLMAFFLSALTKTDSGYLLFNISSHLIALLIMLPTTFLAGMTLPLFTAIILGKGYGEKSIGHIYSINTVGAIIGIIFTIFIGMPYLGLKNSLIVGSSLDILIGLFFLNKVYKFYFPIRFGLATFSFIIFILGSIFLLELDYKNMSSGVYRDGVANLNENESLLFHKDGMTASVSVTDDDGIFSIKTNGKSDAALNIITEGEFTADEYTMFLLGVLPLAISSGAESAAIIGMGSGLTTHTILGSSNIKTVNTIEIEPAMIEGANFFRPRVERAFSEDRSHLYIEDAKTFFSSRKEKYDIIVSEPSNPWVSGVSSLFTEEFYGLLPRHLTKNGVLVQWIHTYEMNTQLVLSILSALSSYFNYYHIYATNDFDLVVIASVDRPLSFPSNNIFKFDILRDEMAYLGINNRQDLRTRFLGGNTIFNPVIHYFGAQSNSDYFPMLDFGASRARYLGERTADFLALRYSNLPILSMYYPKIEVSESSNISQSEFLNYTIKYKIAADIFQFGHSNMLPEVTTAEFKNYQNLYSYFNECGNHINTDFLANSILQLSIDTVSRLHANELMVLHNTITSECKDIDVKLKDFADLFLAASLRDANEMARISEKILEEDFSLSFNNKAYLIGIAMLSHNFNEEYDKTIKIMDTYGKDLYANQGSNLPFSLLILISIAMENS